MFVSNASFGFKVVVLTMAPGEYALLEKLRNDSLSISLLI